MVFIDVYLCSFFFFFFQAEDGIRDYKVTGVQTCALPIFGGAQNVQHIIGADVVVIRDVDDAAVGWVDGHRNIAPGALEAENALEVEFDVLDDADAGLAVRWVDQGLKLLRTAATRVVADDHDVRGAQAAARERPPRVIDGIDGSVRVDGRPDRRAVLT